MLTKRRLIVIAAAGAALGLAAPAQAMKIDGFLKVPDIPGESKAAGHENEIELISVSFGHDRQGDQPATGRAGTADITLKRGRHSDGLDRAARVKTKFPWMTLSVPDSASRAGYVKYRLENVYITSYQTGAAGGDIPPTETISLTYEKIDRD